MAIDLKKYKGIPGPVANPYGLELRGNPFVDLSIQEKWNIPDKVIVKVAITGALFSKAENPNHPTTPEEIIKEAMEVIEAGATSLHIHVRDKYGIPTGDLKAYRDVIDPIREKYGKSVIIDGCALFGLTLDKMLEPVIEGLFEVCPVNTTAVYIGNTLFAIPPKTMQGATEIMQEVGCKPQIAVYTQGDIDNARRYLIDTKILKKPYYWIIVPALPGCAPMPNQFAMLDTLLGFVRRIYEIDKDSIIIVCASARASIYLSNLAILLGLHVRIGMEDTIYRYPHKEDLIKNNKEVVKSTIDIIEQLGREVATADDYRSIVGISG